MLRNRLVAVLTTVLAGAVVLGVAGCSGGTTAPAPTPVKSTDLTSSDGGFDEHAVVGVVLAPLSTDPVPTDSAPATTLDARFRAAIEDAGYTPEVRVAAADATSASQQTALHDVVKAGAKVVFVQAVDPDGIVDQVRYAHDAGAIVVAVGAAIPGTAESGSRADFRVADTADATLVSRSVTMIDDLQRGKRPSGA